jgi:two-component system, chemotaxis family, protein-glutamate methylesterase/glutaminase
MTVEDGHLRTLRGPREHFTRPAADPLFRSAAAAYGPRVVGVVLSGGGSDGMSGLIAIKKAGGVSLAQSPTDAQTPSMPKQAIAGDDVDAVLAIEALGDYIAELVCRTPDVA